MHFQTAVQPRGEGNTPRQSSQQHTWLLHREPPPVQSCRLWAVKRDLPRPFHPGKAREPRTKLPPTKGLGGEQDSKAGPAAFTPPRSGCSCLQSKHDEGIKHHLREAEAQSHSCAGTSGKLREEGEKLCADTCSSCLMSMLSLGPWEFRLWCLCSMDGEMTATHRRGLCTEEKYADPQVTYVWRWR